MLSQAVQIFRDVLQDSLQTHWADGPIRVRTGRVKDRAPGSDAALLLSLANLSVDGCGRSGPPGTLPPLRLTVLLSTSPGLGYTTSLQLLSSALRICHTMPVLTPQANPQLKDEFERITISPVSLDLDGLRGLWDLQGAPYQPSMVYELRAVPLNLRPSGSWLQPVSADGDYRR